jgi:hypothetical protein
MEGLIIENAFLFYKYVFWSIILNILRPLRAFGNFVVIRYIFPCFNILYREKSGNPDLEVYKMYVQCFSMISTKGLFSTSSFTE